VPAGVLRALCVGASCDEGTATGPRVPFCPLPDALKQAIANGYREGRSPDVLAAIRSATAVAGPQRTGLGPIPWPSTAVPTSVPLVFSGPGVPRRAIPAGTTLDRIAPTVADVIGLQRPFPEVRSGTALDGFSTRTRPRLVLLVGWKGVGTNDLGPNPDAWPFLSGLLAEGAGALDADTGSLPVDPAATLTTIGTGGLPLQHGITGAFIRNDEGEVVPAFGDGAPVTVIATLADDLEEGTGGDALVGLVAPDATDGGIVGGGWYPDEDPAEEIWGDGSAVPLGVDALLAAGFGADDVTDVIGIVLDGSIRSMDTRTRRIVSAAERATEGAVLTVVAGTGGADVDGSIPAGQLLAQVEDAVPGEASVVSEAVPGGLFLDQTVLAREEITGQVVVDALLASEGPDGERMVADAFQGFAVSFARYC
jgi:hypothetical protein